MNPHPIDIDVSFPREGCIRLRSKTLFADPEGEHCKKFLDRVLKADVVRGVTVKGSSSVGDSELAEIYFCPNSSSRQEAVASIYAQLTNGDGASHTNGHGPNGHANGKTHTAHTHGPNGHTTNGHGANGHASNGHAKNGHTANGHAETAAPAAPTVEPERPRRFSFPGLRFGAAARKQVTLHRHGPSFSSWEVKHELPGRIRLKNEKLYRRKEVCQAIERELMSVLGVDNFKTSPLTSTVLIVYDERKLTRDQLVEILDGALNQTERSEKPDKPDLSLPLCTLALPLTAVAQFLAPPLIPVAAALFIYNSIPTFKSARDVLFDERRLGVDVLDAIVVVGCLSTLQVFPGAVLCWCLGFGRVLVKKTQDDSKRLLLNAFGKQPRYVWLYRDGVEVQISLDRLQQGDVIVVNTGEVVPVDGFIKEGMAMVDQHALTGESTPAEKGIGDRVFAATVMVAGKIFVEVEKSGDETASAKISQILNDSAGYKLSSQHKGEALADKAVIPTLALGALGLVTMGPAGAVAILNSDFGTGIRMAAPLAMLNSLALCAHKGILVKDGRALELMNEIDTVLFDKTGTLTRERPEVGRVIACGPFSEDRILQFAAAAENKFSHPIAKAILHKFEALGLPMPAIDDSKYHVGYGITVNVEGHTIRVGSTRFMEMEGLAIPPVVREALDGAHLEGNTLVMVGVDNDLGGALELQAAVRPEVREIIKGLRDRGVKHIAIISGDHEAPTRKLAESLGMDRYFAQVLPADKAQYVEQLQKEGGKVCFVGDGINDSIALKKANVSISLRGASTIATDTAHIVFLEEGLSKLCDLRDISRNLDHNVRRSWSMILAPNGFCIFGAFTMGFGVMTSVLMNNVSALAALANGMLPLRKIADAQEQSRLEQEARLAHSAAEAAKVLAARAQGTDSAPEAERITIEQRPVAEPVRRSAVGTNSALGECLYERPLNRPFDATMREAVLAEALRRRAELPFSAEFRWHPTEPRLLVKCYLMSFTVSFVDDRLKVDAKLSFAARALATQQNRRQAVEFLDSIATRLDL